MASQPARDEFGGILVQNQPARDEFGGIPVAARPAEPAPKSFGEQVADIPRGWWNQLSAVGQGMVDLGTAIANPTDKEKGLGAAFHSMSESNLAPLNKAAESFKSGDPVSGLAHSVHYLLNALPGFGTALDEAGEDYRKGNWGQGTGKTLGLATVTLPPDAVGNAALGVARSAATPLRATGAAIKAAAPDLALGTGKVAVGTALTKAGLPPVARELLGWEVGLKPGGKQIAGGLGKGYDAFKQTFADAAEARAARPTVETPLAAQGAPESPAGSPGEPAAAAPAEATAPGVDPAFAKFLNDLSLGELGGGVPFETLKAKSPLRAAVLEKIAHDQFQKQAGTATGAAAAPPSVPLPEYPGATPPGVDAAALIRQELADRRAAQATAAPAEAPTPAETQPAAPAAPAAQEPAPVAAPAQQPPVAAPAPGPEITPGMGPDDLAAKLQASIKQIEQRKAARAAVEAKADKPKWTAEDFAAANRAKSGGPAETLAKEWIDGQGKTVDELKNLDDAGWKKLAQVHRKNYNPSADTRALTIERAANLEAAKAAPAPAPTPAPAPPDVIAQTARELRGIGRSAADVAKYTPDMLQKIGVQPFQVKALLRAMMSDETRPPAAQAAAAGQ